MNVWLVLITISIPLLFLVNLAVFVITRKRIIVLEQMVFPKTNRRDGIRAELYITAQECQKLREHVGKASAGYTFFVNITSIFPLLGILGTVASLMALSGTDDLASSFSSALLTTLLGIIFAIFFKILDGFISPRLEMAIDNSNYIIREHDKQRGEEQCVEEET